MKRPSSLSICHFPACLAIIACWIRAQFKAEWFQFHRIDPHANTWRAQELSGIVARQ
jgi:hypothetical protein